MSSGKVICILRERLKELSLGRYKIMQDGFGCFVNVTDPSKVARAKEIAKQLEQETKCSIFINAFEC